MIAGMTVISCTKEYEPNPGANVNALLQDSYTWYPLAPGHQWTYSIDSVYYYKVLSSQVRDTVQGIYRETVTDTFPGHGGLTYRILREKEVNGSWQEINVYSVTRDRYQVIRTEDNISLIDMVFPVTRHSSWDPYLYTDKNREFLIKGHRILLYNNFNSSVISDSTSAQLLGGTHPVIEVSDGESDDMLILRQYSKKWYAKGIGLIRKEQELSLIHI